MVAALIAVLTAPLAGVALLATGARTWCSAGWCGCPDRLRLPLGLLFGLGRGSGWPRSAVGTGPLAGAGRSADRRPRPRWPASSAGLLVVGLAWRQRGLAAPGAHRRVSLLLVAALAPGPSRAPPPCWSRPMLVVAGGLLLDQLGERMPRPADGRRWCAAGAAGRRGPDAGRARPTGRRRPAGATRLIAWLVTEPRPGTAVQADDLDRAELLVAGFPAAQLRGPQDPPVPGDAAAGRRPTDRRVARAGLGRLPRPDGGGQHRARHRRGARVRSAAPTAARRRWPRRAPRRTRLGSRAGRQPGAAAEPGRGRGAAGRSRSIRG